MFKVNEYFDGTVKSIAFGTAEGPATIGVMAPGEYEFGPLKHVKAGLLDVAYAEVGPADGPVAVGRNRPAAAKLLIEAGCDVVIADDGLQHYALARDLEICVIDGVRRFGNGRLLPAGPLREPMSRLQKVDYRVCNGGVVAPGDIPMELKGGTVRALVDDHTQPLADFAGQAVHAVAGIGNPQRFFNTLETLHWQPVPHAFADHAEYSAAALNFTPSLPLVMTEKDAVKCRTFAAADWWYLTVDAAPSPAFVAWFDTQLMRLLPARLLP